MTVEEAGAHRESIERVVCDTSCTYSEINYLGEDRAEKQCLERLAVELANKLINENIIMFDKQYSLYGIDYKAVIYAIKFKKRIES